jgi:hypothetical protein
MDAAFRQIVQVSDGAVGGFAENSASMTRQLIRDAAGPESTGRLAASVHVEHVDEMSYALIVDAPNQSGRGYGASQDWGWHARNGRKLEGKKSVIRATCGMIKRWRRGEKWRDAL